MITCQAVQSGTENAQASNINGKSKEEAGVDNRRTVAYHLASGVL